MYKNKIIAGFAGATADAFTLFEKFEAKLEEFSGNLLRASVELAKEWRTDKYLRRLEAMLLVANAENILLISGTGDVIEPDDNIIGIALVDHTPWLLPRHFACIPSCQLKKLWRIL